MVKSVKMIQLLYIIEHLLHFSHPVDSQSATWLKDQQAAPQVGRLLFGRRFKCNKRDSTVRYKLRAPQMCEYTSSSLIDWTRFYNFSSRTTKAK